MTGLGSHSIATARAKNLSEQARRGAQATAANTGDWHFYRGIQAAADAILHADVQAVRTDDDAWLEREHPAFREGYLKASTALAEAAAAPVPPLYVAVPARDRTSPPAPGAA